MANSGKNAVFDTGARERTVLAIRPHARDSICALVIDAIKFEIE
jgi:hypothetical protein